MSTTIAGGTLAYGGAVLVDGSNLYAVFLEDTSNDIEIWEDIGGTPSLLASQTPTQMFGSDQRATWIDAAIDSNGDIHVVGSCINDTSTRDHVYNKYEVGVGWGTWTEIGAYNQSATPGCAIDIDGSDVAHVAYLVHWKDMGQATYTWYYKNNASGWSTAEEIGSGDSSTGITAGIELICRRDTDEQMASFPTTISSQQYTNRRLRTSGTWGTVDTDMSGALTSIGGSNAVYVESTYRSGLVYNTLAYEQLFTGATNTIDSDITGSVRPSLSIVPVDSADLDSRYAFFVNGTTDDIDYASVIGNTWTDEGSLDSDQNYNAVKAPYHEGIAFSTVIPVIASTSINTVYYMELLLSQTHSLASATTAVSDTDDTVILSVPTTQNLTATISCVSNTTDTAILKQIIPFTSATTAVSSATDTAIIGFKIFITAAITSASSTTNTAILSQTIGVIFDGTAGGATPDDAILTQTLSFIGNITSNSSSSDDVVLLGLATLLTSSSTAITSTPDNIRVIVSVQIGSTLDMQVTLSKNYGGPFQDTNGNLYLVLRPNLDDTELSIYKSADYGLTWAEQDSAGRPAYTDEAEAWYATIYNDEIHIAVSGAEIIKHSIFYVSSHGTTPDEWESTPVTVIATYTDTGSEQGIFIGVQSDGDIIIFTAGENTLTRERVDTHYSTDGGDNWTTKVQFCDRSTSYDNVFGGAVIGKNDKIHGVWNRDDTDELYHRSLVNVDSSPSTSEDACGGTYSKSPQNYVYSAPMVYYETTGGNEKVLVIGHDTSDTAWASYVTDDGTPATPEQISTTGILRTISGGHVTGLTGTVLNQKVFIFFIDDTSFDIKVITNDDEAGWTGESVVLGVTAAAVWVGYFENDGIAYAGITWTEGIETSTDINFASYALGSSAGVEQLATSITADTTTPDNVVLSGDILLTSSITAVSNTPDTAVIHNDLYLTAAITANSTTPDNLTLVGLVDLVSAATATSTTPDTSILGVKLALSSAITAVSVTPDTATLTVDVAALSLSASATANTATPDDITLSGTVLLTSATTAASSTPDDITLAGTVLLTSATTAVSSTPDDVALTRNISTASDITAVSDTTDTAILSTATPLVADITTISSTPDDVVLSKDVSLSVAITASSATPDDATILGTVYLTSTATGVSATPDDATITEKTYLAVSVTAVSNTNDSAEITEKSYLVFAATSNSATTDTAILSQDISLVSGIAASSATPDTVALSISGQVNLAADIQIVSSTPDDASLSQIAAFTSAAIAVSDTQDATLSNKLGLAISITAASNATDVAVLQGVFSLVSASIATSATPDNINLTRTILVLFSETSISSTNDSATLTLSGQADLTADIQAISNTPDDVVLSQIISFINTSIAASDTLDTATLRGAISPAVATTAISATPDDANLSQQILSLFTETSISSTNDSAILAISGEIDLAVSITASSITPDDVILTQVISPAFNGIGISSTSDNGILSGLFDLIAAISGASNTTDVAELVIGTDILLSVSISGDSSTNDSVILSQEINLTSAATTQSNTSDADLIISGYVNLAVNIQATSSTSDIIILKLDFVLGADQQSYTYTGQDANLLRGFTLSTDYDTIGMSGQDVSVRADRILPITQDSITLTGMDAGLIIGKGLTAGQAAFSLTGQDVAFDLVYLISAIYRTYTLTVRAAGLTFSGEILTTPIERKRVISSENRTMAVNSENRTYIIKDEDRTLVI